MLSKRLLIGHRITLGFSVPVLALLTVGYFSLRNLDDMQREASWVTHTIEVMAELRQFNDSLSRVEAAARGYVLSGDQALSTEFNTQRQLATASAAKLRGLTADNPNQQSRTERLDTLMRERGDQAQQLLTLRDRLGNASGPEIPSLVRNGQQLSDDIRTVTTDMVTEETHLLAARQQASRDATQLTRNTVIFGSLAAFLVTTVSGLMLALSITRPLAKLRSSANRIGEGDYAHRADVEREDEVGHLATVFNRMSEQVQQRQDVLQEQDWLKSGLTMFAAHFQRERDPRPMGRAVLGELESLIGARHSVLYQAVGDTADPRLELCASYAAEQPPARLAFGEGLVGQCAASQRRIVLMDVPSNYLRISSALGAAQPAMIVVEPVLFEGKIKAVLELASLQPFSELQLELISRLAASLGIVLQNIEATVRTAALLAQSQALTGQLEAQQETLAEKNTELESQADRLRKSEKLLQEQQVELTQTNEELEQTNEEMEQANEELEEKANLLSNQKRELELSNRAIEQARMELQEKARQLAVTSTYKSNFLATMSHELRTPLNSLLILARLLAENRDANLTPKQVQFAHTIESSGADLLELINQILDLAKIESGTVEVQLADISPAELQRSIESQFRQMAETKKLQFEIAVAPDMPAQLHTDAARLHQVIKNLLSNAFKFTEKGSIKLTFNRAKEGWPRSISSLTDAPEVVAISVTDTGIGIPKDKQQIIFEAFQQADAGTARRFGGTGLGLSISRELATMLGGVLLLDSESGKGSTFTLYVPAVLQRAPGRPTPTRSRFGVHAETSPAGGEASSGSSSPDSSAAPTEPPDFGDPVVADDRDTIVSGDRVILVIEDDVRFASLLVDFAHEKRFKVLVARSARHGLALAQRFLPVAITLDLRLTDEDGWLVLDRLKHDQRTRHIPVHVISVEPNRHRGLRLGAVSYLQKPVTKDAIQQILQHTVDFIDRPVKNLLVVEDDETQRDAIRELIGNNDVHTTAVGSAAEALAALAAERFDCVVLDLVLPDQTGVELIREINRRHGLQAPPVIVYTGKELSPQEETELRSLSESIIVKDARSPERLLDETALFLHRVQARLPEAKRRMLEQVRRQDAILTGRHVLVVDDDVRNIFALTAALESYGMIVKFAESGKAAIAMLDAEPDYDVVLMDVMMPEMDGNEATRRLRGDARFAKLPIIAVTAKAMKGDRERSIEAGASDYITKPVDTEKLVSLLRVWLYR